MGSAYEAVKALIACAIREADRRYFFEDYTVQAENVLRSLAMEGYLIVPERPDLPMQKAGCEAIAPGPAYAGDHVAAIYDAMIRQWVSERHGM
jgi:hypothetical protein